MVTTKADLRKINLKLRLGLTDIEVKMLSSEISDNFFTNFSLKSIRNLHVFLPIASKREVDTFQIVSKIFSDYPQLKLLVPVLQNGDMFNVYYENGMELKYDKFGIPNPIPEKFCLEIPDMVLVPMLGFDQKGNRVGYGGGYYDKYLSSLPLNVLKVGLCFYTSIEEIIDVDEFDVALDFCITPNKIYDFAFRY